MNLISRSDRGAMARWWFTIDRTLMCSVMLLMAVGVLVSMAASPPVAERIGLDSFHFFKGQLVFLGLGLCVLTAGSFLSVSAVRRFGLLAFVAGIILMALALKFGPEIKGAHRWIFFGAS